MFKKTGKSAMNKIQIAGMSLNTISLISKKRAGAIALDLFCRPYQGRTFSVEEQAFLKTATWKSYTFQQEKIQCYSWEGKGKTILLAHGFNSNTARWRFLVPLLLKEGYRVVALDAPAHGHSAWNRVNALLYAQTIEHIMPYFEPDIVIGHSFGGMALAYYFAELEALPIEKMVLMSVPAELTDIEKVFLNTLKLNQRTHQAFIQAFEQQFNFKRETFSIVNYIKKTNISGLVIHDEGDDIAPFSGGQRIYKNWKNASLLKTEGLGHSVQGDIVYQAILKFIKNGSAKTGNN